jgi:hypothetical protein
VFNIAIKRNKQKYRATSTVAMTTSKQCIVVKWKIPMQKLNCKSCPILTSASTKEKKCRILILKLVYWFFWFFTISTWISRKSWIIFSLCMYIVRGNTFRFLPPLHCTDLSPTFSSSILDLTYLVPHSQKIA